MLSRCGKGKIFVADKSKGFLNATKSLLEDAGFRVKAIRNGKEALGQIKGFKYDLLVLGKVMPRIDGIRLLQIVRKNETYADIPVLFVSDYSSKEESIKHKGKMAGKARGHIQRPFKTDSFLTMVKALLDNGKNAIE